MAITIGSARVDENGTYSGGAAGDQTGKEVSTQSFYMHSKGWYILRAKKVSYANAIATAMKDACANDYIGYDQSQRGTLLTQYKSYGSIKAIKTKCECDCSALVRVCILQATGTDVGNFTTANLATVLVNSGLFEKKTCSSSADVYNGDVLVTKTKGHTVVVTAGRARTTTSTVTVNGKWNKETTELAQKVFGTTVDGIVSDQYTSYKSKNPGLLSETFEWKTSPGKNGSQLIKAIQKKIGLSSNDQDGYIGTQTIKAMQKWLGTTQDGYVSNPSQMVKAFQTWLNKQV